MPLNRLSQNEMSVITDLTKWLGDTIKGQDLAIASLHKQSPTARADLRRPGRPLGAFLRPARAARKPKPSCNWQSCLTAVAST